MNETNGLSGAAREIASSTGRAHRVIPRNIEEKGFRYVCIKAILHLKNMILTSFTI